MAEYKGPIHNYCRTGYPFTGDQLDNRGIKLNVGCYYSHIDNFINIDINPDVNPDVVCDMRDLRGKFKHYNVSLILMSQVLEHVDKVEGQKVLKDCYDILKPGGYLIVEVPDCSDIEEKFARGEISEHSYHIYKEGTSEVPYQEHKAMYSKDELIKALTNAGFNQLIEMPIEMTSMQDQSIRIDARKE